jgi:hypothetical protein
MVTAVTVTGTHQKTDTHSHGCPPNHLNIFVFDDIIHLQS